MMNLVFNMPVRMLKVGEEMSPHHAEETRFQEWNFGRAIIHILKQPDHHRHLFNIELDEARVDHLTAQRLAESSLFKRWQSRNEV
ncbi:hypothetical protein [Novosphingobium rosa]|jgi:hypothetical protein|uniref:hypothetical protein n=1 Tax=Novosphingobium rosa TaxID=76978 RepID=UPI000835F290|nr:hypothetical protein [Novosphingobium rosa]